jgi:hypothetical protein
MGVRPVPRVPVSPAPSRSARARSTRAASGFGPPRAVRTPVAAGPPGPEATPGWRVLRGVVVGSAATGLAAAGHRVADGAPPALWALLGAAVATGAAGVALSRLRWTLPRLLALLLVTQPVLHALFAGSRPDLAEGAATGPLAHVHAHGAVHTPVADHAAGLDPLAALLASEPAMTAAHTLAAVVTAVLLGRGERWLCGVLDALALRAVRLLRGLVPVYGVRPRPVPVRVQSLPRPHDRAYAWSQRGPPC